MSIVQSRPWQPNWRKRSLLGERFRGKIIGKPHLVETTVHEDFIDQLPTVHEIHATEGAYAVASLRRGSSPPVIDSDKLMKELPPLSFQLDEKQYLTPRPISEVPTASSIYTKASPEFPYEFDPASQVAPLFAGRSRPLENAQNEIRDEQYEQYSDEEDWRPTLNDRARQNGVGHLGLETSGRAAWQGASGQITQLTPITATPATTAFSGSVSPIDEQKDPAYFPRYTSDVYSTPKDQFAKMTTNSHKLNLGSGATPSPQFPSSPPYLQQTPPPVSRFSWTTAAETEAPKTVAPSTPTTMHSLESGQSPSPAANYRRYQQSPTPGSRSQNYVATSRYHPGGMQYNNLPTPPDSSPAPIELPKQQLLYEGHSTAPHTVPDIEITPSPPASIMSRTRPLAHLNKPPKVTPEPALAATPPNHPNAMKIKRKPTPSEAASTLATATPDSAADKHKSLPLTPTALDSVDHITMLQSQLSALTVRKHNLSKLIESLTELFAPPDLSSPAAGPNPGFDSLQPTRNPMVLDLGRRRETKAKVDALQRDLAEVRREEYDLGLKLMRAQQRRDQEAPSALWVRRVTRVSDAR